MLAAPASNLTRLSRLPLALASLALMTPACSVAQTPTQADIEAVMKEGWDKAGPPKAVLTLNSVKFGKPYKATAQEVQVEGIPRGMVTPAIVNFTVRTYYDSETQALKRVREARVYKDRFGDWAVMTGSPKGEDVTTVEPPVK
jgi:hypothetical protein